ncbi:TetR/AcrR family transcriptional regulator [Pleomorphovibrio marinus]|uniref:TetR/AcrR family transcriptional regulator n=1 Tax=Pleomorphovibrio marinus TaxID=2164132 RepID=UPI000E0B58EB|nr:TetR family transcriptional regulator C-terminal domain-containing protein [Pleomorphovibrio marinus]
MTEENKSASAEINRDSIIEGYVEYVLENGKEPVSLYKFAKSLHLKEEELYAFFTSFEAIKAAVWELIFDRTVQELQNQEVYPNYSAREKLLGFYFTWIEHLKKKRSYLISLYQHSQGWKAPYPQEIKVFKEKFKSFVGDIVLEGKETEEIANRPYISEKYDEALWLQVMFLFQFWLKDTSQGFEKTDAAIEKSVNLAFDLMGKSAVDSFLDFAKFLYQSKPS